MSDADLKGRVRSATIFARTMPEQKLRIVNALKANGEVVAMTGDGVNDAPSLKAAHIGIAMGGRGTDVAREAASLILLDDDFTSIVAAVRLGRRIYDNLRKAMAYILAIHVPIAGLALIPLLFGLPLLFWPLHIAFLEMVIDPVCSIVFEAESEEADTMRRPPRAPSAPLFTAGFVIWSLLQGVLALALVAGRPVDTAAYDQSTGQWSRLFVPSVLDAAGVDQGWRVLDVSTGTGEAALAIAPVIGASGLLVGADIAPAMLESARTRLRQAAFLPVAADGQALPFADGSFDAVICQLGLQFFPNPGLGLMEFRRVLRDGGRIAICVASTPDRVPLWGILAEVLGSPNSGKSSNCPSRSQINRAWNVCSPPRVSIVSAWSGNSAKAFSLALMSIGNPLQPAKVR
jgi:hypothetical protein